MGTNFRNTTCVFNRKSTVLGSLQALRNTTFVLFNKLRSQWRNELSSGLKKNSLNIV